MTVVHYGLGRPGRMHCGRLGPFTETYDTTKVTCRRCLFKMFATAESKVVSANVVWEKAIKDRNDLERQLLRQQMVR